MYLFTGNIQQTTFSQLFLQKNTVHEQIHVHILWCRCNGELQLTANLHHTTSMII
uniref:Uncharacterized protein n=1 Tax=Anguilla anguilla TaxID=7936 RepID=A0A0E9SCG9_ANGAN